MARINLPKAIALQKEMYQEEGREFTEIALDGILQERIKKELNRDD